MGATLFDKTAAAIHDTLITQLREPYLSFYRSFGTDYGATYMAASKLSEPDARQLAIIRQIDALSKRFIGKSSKKRTSKKERDSACFAKFEMANSLSKKQNDAFCDLDSDVMTTLEIARNDIDSLFWKQIESEDSEFLWLGNELLPISGFSTGPGSCTGVEGTSTYEKYYSKWGTSSEAGRKMILALRKLSKPMHDLPRFACRVEAAVKASFVPKDLDISRLIAPQQNGDLYLQYPVCSFLENMLRFIGIDFETQQFTNREMARKGSYHDNFDIYDFHLQRRNTRFCTIDLVSASDIVGIELTKFLAPVPLYNYMALCRAEFILDQSGDEFVPLHMMATMGNAYCFPWQTLVFSSLVRAVYKRLGLPLKDRYGKPTYSVYGDDIIVDVAAYEPLIKVLELLQMKPNHKKSFMYGLFRESCGADFFNGYDIRPVFCEELRTDCDLYSVSNRLLDWGMRHSVNVAEPVRLLLGAVRKKVIVPLDYGAHEGLRIPYSMISYMPKDWRVSVSMLVRSERDLVWILNFATNKLQAEYVRNSYSVISLTRLVNESLNVKIALHTADQSLFPFLRGGFTFEYSLKKNKHGAKIERSYIHVPLRKATRVLEETVEIPHWDSPVNYAGSDSHFWNETMFAQWYLRGALFD